MKPEKTLRIALAGNPNSGKTTLFNRLTGANQFVGNWPGVTVEKKEGRIREHHNAHLIDLPGIYSLSPYTLEERVARNFLIDEKPDAILNIVDGSSLERSLYLTTQLAELGIPMVIAINMSDVLKKKNEVIDIDRLAKHFGQKVCLISALHGSGVREAASLAVSQAQSTCEPKSVFHGEIEHAIAHIEDHIAAHQYGEKKRWLAVHLFERDADIQKRFANDKTLLDEIDREVKPIEEAHKDDAESIIANERYVYIASIMDSLYKKRRTSSETISDKIDKVVTNRILALPIFAAIIFLVYYLSISTIGTRMTDWTNDKLFGDGFHLFGIGTAAYEEQADIYNEANTKVEAFEEAAKGKDIDPAKAENLKATAIFRNDDGDIEKEEPVTYADYMKAKTIEEPDPAAYGVFIPSVPDLVKSGLDSIHAAPWLSDLIINGIIAGVGAVLGFVPQMLVLFLCLAILESCGYMARIAFVMDRLFRRFGLSGKSFIPILVGTGCSVPGIMATRTIENLRDRRLTIITTPFMPCSAKLPIIALIAGALFNRNPWIATSCYFIGIGSVIISGIILKKFKRFAGDPAPFVMELPAYRIPRVVNVLRSMWERGWSFIKKAGTIILLATIVIWFLSTYGFGEDGFGAVDMETSLLASIGHSLKWLFIPLGFGDWKATVATFTGLTAKESVLSTFGILYANLDAVADNGWQIWDNVRASFTQLSAFSFLLFNLLCAPCFAAIGATKREMGTHRWTLFTIGYQCVYAYGIAFMVYQFGRMATGANNVIGFILALAVLALFIWLLVRPAKRRTALTPSYKTR